MYRFSCVCILCIGIMMSMSGVESVELLNEKMPWIKHYVFIPPKVSVQSAEAAGKATDPEARARLLLKRVHSGFETIPPAGNWQGIAFDDSDWHTATGTNLSKGDSRVRSGDKIYVRGTDPFLHEIGLIAQRGTFIVNDPAQVKKLTLRMAYRGGAVVFLNGKKIMSLSLPQGEISYDTAAEDYPLDAFVITDEKGKHTPLHWYKHRDEKFMSQWHKRERTSDLIELDTKLLVKGANVLAVELHRSDYPVECTAKSVGLCFSPVGLGTLSLQADTNSDNIVTAMDEPKEIRLWQANTWETLTQKDSGNATAVFKGIHIVGAKNGTFAGQLMISSPVPIDGIDVITGSLKSDTGEIASEHVTCKYAALNAFYSKSNRFDVLLDTPPLNIGNNLPIWLMIKVPADAIAGTYTGTVELKINGGKSIAVPVAVDVADWRVPDVRDYTPITVLYQSPDSLARHFKVDKWSEEHWALIEKSLKLMGEFGNCGLMLDLLAESCTGNPESMVVWSQQADGTYSYDLTHFDRYMQIAMKYHSVERLKMVSLNVWGYQNSIRKGQTQSPGSLVTVISESGKKSNVKLPQYGTPECEAMWKPLLLAIQERLKKYKIDDKIMFGIGGDRMPSPAQAAMFNRILPGTPWFRESHFPLTGVRVDEDDKSKSVGVGITSMVWGEGIPDPHQERRYGWKYNPENIRTNFKRDLDSYNDVWDFRQWMESTIVGGRNGNSRVGGDFYNLGIRLENILSAEEIKSLGFDGKRAQGTLFNTYPPSNVAQTALGESVPDLFGAVTDGPVTTVRFENARLGNQEAEARIVIEKAILDKKLSPELEKKCQALLDSRTNALRLWFSKGRRLADAGWNASNRQLFDLAGEVQNLSQKGNP